MSEKGEITHLPGVPSSLNDFDGHGRRVHLPLAEAPVRQLFRTAQRAAPCIIFFDQLDGMEQRSQVIVIGATNSVERIDPAALRPGRFGVHLYVGLPDAADRAEILRIHLRSASLDPGLTMDELIGQLVGLTDGFSGADLAFLCQNARLHALERCGLGSDGGI